MPASSSPSSPSPEFTFFDEFMFHIHRTVERSGWMIQYVIHSRPWAYTIGLALHFDHPELVIAGATASSSGGALDRLGRRVAAGERFAADAVSEFDLAGVSARLVPVHPDHWATDRFATWVNYVCSLGPPFPEPAALQLLWPDDEGRFPDDAGCALRPRVERLDLAPRRWPGTAPNR